MSQLAASTPDPAPIALSIGKLAEMVGVGRTTLYREIRADRLRVRKIGKRSVVMVDDVRRWLEGR